MDRDDILDLLTIVAVGDRRTTSDADVIFWQRVLTGLAKDDCLDAIEAFRREQPGVWLEPGHVVRRVKAVLNDRYERGDEDVRAAYNQPYGASQDRFGYVDKGVEDEDYPREWTSEQRLAAYWEKIERMRDASSFTAVASTESRHEAMAHIRSVLGGVR